MGLLDLHIGMGISGRNYLADAERENRYICQKHRTLVDGAYGFGDFICRNLCACSYLPAAGSMLHDSQSRVSSMFFDFPDVAVHENTGQMQGDGFPGKIFLIHLHHAGHDLIRAYELHGHPEALAVLSDSRSGDAYSGGYCTKSAE